jgi:hypothetical protein
VKALELFLNEDHDALWKDWQSQLDYVSKQVTRVSGVSTSFFVPDIANHVPHMAITWDPDKVSITHEEVTKALRDSQPSIVLGGGENRPGLVMCSFMLQPGEHKIVAEKLAGVLRQHSVA